MRDLEGPGGAMGVTVMKGCARLRSTCLDMMRTLGRNKVSYETGMRLS